MSNQHYRNERKMYPAVCAWLNCVLSSKFPKSRVIVDDTSQTTLKNYLERRHLSHLFSDYQTYEIRVDVTGIVQKKEPCLAFVECKLTAPTLRDLGQLLGYSKVARPTYSILISPVEVSQALSILLKVHRRYDLLEYVEGKRIKIGRWNTTCQQLDPATIIPVGEHL